jgi:5-methyltetrahydropteroyltriglutamate--homocysteine methyltransferase
MKRSTDRILTTHVGSLNRPPDLMDVLREKYAGHPYDEGAYQERLRADVAEVVKKQVDVGVDVPSDGEFGKPGFNYYPHERMTGFTPRPPRPPTPQSRRGRDRSAFPDFYDEYDRSLQHATGDLPAMECTGPITYRGQELLKRDLDNFKAALSGVEVADAFYAAVAPNNFGRGENKYYPSSDAFIEAVAEALKTEYRMIVDAGFVLQVDAPLGTYDLLSMSLEEFRVWLERGIEMLNHALEGIPEDRVRYHMCWGSWHGPHKFDVPMKDVIDIVLKSRAQAISFEAANPAHEHEYEDWEDLKLPEGKILLPGVVTHSTNIIENPRLVAQRIERYANLVGRENVIASTDCGFSQGAFSAKIHPSLVWAKLEALAEGARLASERLWEA